MEDNKIWFYIIAAIIYFLTRKKKKKPQPNPQRQESRPSEANSPQQKQKPVSFDDLLKEITEGRVEEVLEPEEYQEPEPIVEEPKEEKKRERKRLFSDEESRRIYEESVARAEEHEPGHDHKFEPDDDYVSKKMFKGSKVEKEVTFADEIREGLQSTESTRKAIIYSEILNRKY